MNNNNPLPIVRGGPKNLSNKIKAPGMNASPTPLGINPVKGPSRLPMVAKIQSPVKIVHAHHPDILDLRGEDADFISILFELSFSAFTTSTFICLRSFQQQESDIQPLPYHRMIHAREYRS